MSNKDFSRIKSPSDNIMRGVFVDNGDRRSGKRKYIRIEFGYERVIRHSEL